VGVLESLVGELVRGVTGLDARAVVRRIGVRRLAALGGMVASGALAARQGGARPEGGGSGGPASSEAAAGPAPPPPPVAATGVPPPPPPPPPAPAAAEPRAPAAVLPGELVVAAARTMVAAVLADGRLEPAEKAAVEARLVDSELTPDQASQVRRDLLLPLPVEGLAALAPGAADREALYAVAALVLCSDQRISDLERRWLGRLGDAFGLDGAARRRLEDEACGAGGPAAPRGPAPNLAPRGT
jgi:uncharacterized membrane protein YebE (DUF533 family)